MTGGAIAGMVLGICFGLGMLALPIALYWAARTGHLKGNHQSTSHVDFDQVANISMTCLLWPFIAALACCYFVLIHPLRKLIAKGIADQEKPKKPDLPKAKVVKR